MKSGKVQINEFRLRASGLTPEQARQLGELVAQRLADARLASEPSRRIPTANVRVKFSKSVEVMADNIVAGIRNKLR